MADHASEAAKVDLLALRHDPHLDKSRRGFGETALNLNLKQLSNGWRDEPLIIYK